MTASILVLVGNIVLELLDLAADCTIGNSSHGLVADLHGEVKSLVGEE
tara:strand:- start:531 stop:674 length:144 start_codon:yes stop_codon:yes gene_type:complete